MNPIIKKYLLMVLIFFIVLEIGLRVLGINATYSEKTNGKFTTYYNQEHEDSYHDWTPNTIRKLEQIEFQFSDSVNSLGIVEKEIELIKPKNTFRIITIGDSFTEGDGAGYEDSYPRNLERILNKNSDTINYEIINAGVCGSDIFYMNKLLEDKLLKYKPDAIIYLLNQSDIDDIIYRGGKERFNADGSVKFKKAPWILPLYRHSYVFRMIFKLNGIKYNLLSKDQDYQSIITAGNLFNHEVLRLEDVFTASNIQYKILKHPIPIDMNLEPLNYSSLQEYYDDNRFECIKQVFKSCNGDDIINECNQVYKDYAYQDYAWNLNGHFNAFGYKKLAEIVYDKILEEDSLFFKLEKNN